MTTDVSGADKSEGLSGRLPRLVEPFSGLDKRARAMLEGLEKVYGAIAGLPELVAESRELVGELRARAARLDQRINRVVDEIEELARQKIAQVDVEGLASSLRRMEEAILNIERSSFNLDRSVEGSLESLPERFVRRARREAEKIDPTRPPEEQKPTGHNGGS